MKIKIIIADDNPFVREGMKIILSTYDIFDILTVVEDGLEAVQFCRENEVDVALLDVRMPKMNGVEATKLIVAETKTKPLILTTFDDDAYILDVIKNGAKGYLLKNNDPEQIKEAIKSVHAGNTVMQDVVLEKIKTNLFTSKPECKVDVNLFTERELDIMSLIARGLSNREISKELFMSEGTIANYITSILSKTNLSHRTQIAIYYFTGKVEQQE